MQLHTHAHTHTHTHTHTRARARAIHVHVLHVYVEEIIGVLSIAELSHLRQDCIDIIVLRNSIQA